MSDSIVQNLAASSARSNLHHIAPCTSTSPYRSLHRLWAQKLHSNSIFTPSSSSKLHRHFWHHRQQPIFFSFRRVNRPGHSSTQVPSFHRHALHHTIHYQRSQVPLRAPHLSPHSSIPGLIRGCLLPTFREWTRKSHHLMSYMHATHAVGTIFDVQCIHYFKINMITTSPLPPRLNRLSPESTPHKTRNLSEVYMGDITFPTHRCFSA